MLSEVHTFSTILPLFGINETPGTGGGRQPHDHGRGSDAPSRGRQGRAPNDATVDTCEVDQPPQAYKDLMAKSACLRFLSGRKCDGGAHTVKFDVEEGGRWVRYVFTVDGCPRQHAMKLTTRELRKLHTQGRRFFKGGKGYSFDAAALRKCGITDPNEIAELISLSEPAAGSTTPPAPPAPLAAAGSQPPSASATFTWGSLGPAELLGVSKHSDQSFVDFYNRRIKGKINPKTGSEYKDAEEAWEASK